MSCPANTDASPPLSILLEEAVLAIYQARALVLSLVVQ